MWGAHSGHCIMLKSIMLKNAFKKHPLQNRTNVQIKGGGVKGLLNNVQKNCTFLKARHPLSWFSGPYYFHQGDNYDDIDHGHEVRSTWLLFRIRQYSGKYFDFDPIKRVDPMICCN